MTIQIDVFYRSSNGDRWELMRDTETGWQSVRHKPNLASGGHDTDTAVQEFLDRTGTSPENMALRALLEKLDAKISSRQLRCQRCTQNSATTVLSLI